MKAQKDSKSTLSLPSTLNGVGGQRHTGPPYYQERGPVPGADLQ